MLFGMYIRTKSSPNSPRKTVQIVESKRNGKSVSQRIVQHIGVAQDEKEMEELKSLAAQIMEKLEEERREAIPQQKTLFGESGTKAAEMEAAEIEVPVEDSLLLRASVLENEEDVIEGPFLAAEYLFEFFGLEKLFTRAPRDTNKYHLLKQCLGASLAFPSSKRGMAAWLEKHCASETSLDRIYRLLDALAKKEDRLKELVRSSSEGLFPERPTLMLFDVTTLYFESFEEDELRQKGFSKDDKVKETQVVLALAATPEGLPLWYRLFPGKTWEGAAFQEFVAAWRRERYSGSTGVVAADRGMFSCARLEALKEKGLHFVLGARLKSMKASEKEAILDRSSYTPLGEKNTKESLEYQIFSREDGQNLLVTWSSKRAAKNARDREESLEKLLKKLNKKKTIPEKQLLSQRGSNRYLKVAHGEKGHSYEPDEEKIASEARWDGLFGILTDLPLTTEEEIREVLSHYRSLWRIEESFRIKKHHLRIRPIFHWTESRIRGHVALQYLTFAAQRHLEKRVLLQQKTAMSPGEIREALLDIRSTLIRDTSTKKLYRFPRKLSSHAKKLLKSLGIPYSTTPREILSLSRYRHRFREGMPKD